MTSVPPMASPKRAEVESASNDGAPTTRASTVEPPTTAGVAGGRKASTHPHAADEGAVLAAQVGEQHALLHQRHLAVPPREAGVVDAVAERPGNVMLLSHDADFVPSSRDCSTTAAGWPWSVSRSS